jgi:hypothetical protein
MKFEWCSAHGCGHGETMTHTHASTSGRCVYIPCSSITGREFLLPTTTHSWFRGGDARAATAAAREKTGSDKAMGDSVLRQMPPKGLLKVNVTDCSSPGINQIAITADLTVAAVIKTCSKKRALDEHLPWWLVLSEGGEDPRSAGIRQPEPLLIAEIIDDASSAGRNTANFVWTLLQDAAATADAKAAAEAKAQRAASKAAVSTPPVPTNFKTVAGILSKIGCSSAFSKFQEEELDDSTLEDLQEEYLVAAGLSEANARLFITELRGGSPKSSAAPAAAARGGSVGGPECPNNFKTIAAALGRIGCGGLMQRFIEEEIDDEMLGDLEQEHLIDFGMSAQQYAGCRCFIPLFPP